MRDTLQLQEEWKRKSDDFIQSLKAAQVGIFMADLF